MAFHGKVAVVTGGGSGMGREAALQLARNGASVAVVDMNEAGMAETASMHDSVKTYRCDVSDLEQVQALVSTIESDLGPIDRLTHCAAIMPARLLTESNPHDINTMMAINYGGTVNMVQTIMPGMIERGAGDIIMFGSMAGDIPALTLGAYCATKAATNSYAEILYQENRDSPLRFLLVCPPMVNTPLINQATEHGPESLAKTRDDGKMATPEFIIDAVEEAIEKGKWVVRPGQAAFLTRWRRWFPGLLWKAIHAAP